MLDQGGLSLDQAPPIWVVFRLFLTGSIFGIIAGLSLFYFQTDVLDPGSTGALVFTHLLTLGVMLSFMFGALFQMLPVIAGVTLTEPIKRANTVQYPLVAGVISLLFAFVYGAPWLFWLASLLLGGVLLHTSVIMLLRLREINNHSTSSRGMAVALISLVLLSLLALYMTGTLGGLLDGLYYTKVKEAHYSFGLFGWIALLIISISFQSIEMFYVTPPYPKLVSQFTPIVILLLLTFSMILDFLELSGQTAANLILSIVLISYATLTLIRLAQRKRPLADATIWFWRIGMGSLIVSMTLHGVTRFFDNQLLLQISIILFVSFAMSVLFAMFYKIVPFLTWFHLNSQGYFTAPMMHEVIHPKTAKKHLWIHIATMVSLLLATVVAPAILLAALLTIVSFAWVGYQVIHALKLYKHTQETGQKMDMSMGL